MRNLFIAMFTICFSSLQVHATVTRCVLSDSTKVFENQEEQENYWAEQFFKDNYGKQIFDKYKGEVVVKGNIFQYGDQILEVANTQKELTAIFSTGLFYPSVLTGNTKTALKSKEEFQKLTAEQKVIYEMSRTDSFTISNLEELPALRKSPAKKRFRFWLHRRGLHNPLVCFFELTNRSATDKADMGTFIKGAELTFYKEGWIII